MNHLKKCVPVSVIIPYDKDRGYLNEAIKSVINQTVNCEIITWQGDCWLSKNLNDAIHKTTGEYIKILAEDDILPSTAIEDLYNGVQGFDWICGDAENFGDLYDGWEKYPLWIGFIPTFEEMIKANQIHGGTTLFRRDMIFEVGGWDESLWTGEEYDLHLKLMKKGYNLGYIHKTVYQYRLHEYNKSMNLDPVDKEKRRQYIREKITERYV